MATSDCELKDADRSRGILLTIGALIGLGVKARMLFYMGVSDMDGYYRWGQRALELGLSKSYEGAYFPLQYQIFELCAWMVQWLNVPFFTIFKGSNIPFDLGSFCLLILLLNRQGSNPLYALLYWLHPWFLFLFSLGYVDFQFTFFVLLCVWLLRSESARDYLLASFALGSAFLMKPQAQILLVATFLYGIFRYARTRDARPLAMLVGPILMFLGYEAYFTASLPLHPRLPPMGAYAWPDLAAAILPSSYLNITNVFPALNAQMTNVWYPIAYLIKKPWPEQKIYEISDQIHVLPYLSAKYLAAGVVLTLVGLHVWRIERAGDLSPTKRFVTIFTFATLVIPFLMTSAHENHLFLGSVFLILIVARSAAFFLQLAVQVLLLVQFLNIYGLYGSGGVGGLAAHSEKVGVVYSLISLACFGLILKPLWLVRIPMIAPTRSDASRAQGSP